jgi:hypothetical protein
MAEHKSDVGRRGARWSILALMLLAFMVLAGGAATRPVATAAIAGTQQAVQPTCGPAYRVTTATANPLPYARYSIRTLTIQQEGFDQAVNDFVTRQVKAFDLDTRRTPPLGDTQFLGTYLTLDFEIHTWSDDLLSIRLYGHFYTGGTVYPGRYSHTINYSRKAGKRLTLADLFQPGADYRGLIVRRVTDALRAQGSRLAQYATPDYETHWNLNETGLLISFDDSYFDQPQNLSEALPQVTIPYSAIDKLIKPDGPIAAYRGRWQSCAGQSTGTF